MRQPCVTETGFLVLRMPIAPHFWKVEKHPVLIPLCRSLQTPSLLSLLDQFTQNKTFAGASAATEDRNEVGGPTTARRHGSVRELRPVAARAGAG
jgi:hypothetical protein